MNFERMLAMLDGPQLPSRPTPAQAKYLKTRDFYDLPIEVVYNNHLYHDAHELERKWFAKKDQRIVIYPKDLVMIYGHSDRTARRYLQLFREEKGLPPRCAILIKDFCNHSQLPYEIVHKFIMES